MAGPLDSIGRQRQFNELSLLARDVAYLRGEIVTQKDGVCSGIPVDTQTLLRSIQHMETMVRNMIDAQLSDTVASTPPVTTAPTAT